MSTNVETGLLPGPEGEVVTYSREEVTPAAAALFRDQAEGQRYRVLTYKGNADGSAVIGHYELSGKALHWFLLEAEDSPGELEEVLSVEAVDGTAVWERQR